MKKSTIIKFVIALIIVMIIFWIILNCLKNRNSEIDNKIQYNYFVLFQNEKMGVIDRDANIVIEPKYDNIIIPNPTKDVFACVNSNQEKKFLNKNNEELYSEFEEISEIDISGIALEVPFEKNILRFKENNKYGLIDYEGNIVLQATYDEIVGLTYKEGELKVKTEEKYGVINTEGREIIKPEYDYIEGDKYYSEKNNKSGYIVGIKNTEGYRYGYLDENKKEILKVEYNNIERVLDIGTEDIYLLAYKNGRGAIIKNKKELTDYDYQKIEKVENEPLFLIEKNEKYGVININGENLVEPEYEEIYVEGLNIFSKKEGKEYVFDLKGELLKNIEYSKRYRTQNDKYFIEINKDGLYGIVDNDGKKVIENEYVYLEYAFHDYFIASNKDGKTGVINKENNQVIDIKYDIVEKLQNGNIIQTVEIENNKLELFNDSLSKIFDGENIQINIRDNYIALINQEGNKYFNLKGEEINNIEEITENSMPEQIEEYVKVYYAYGQVYYTDLESANE